MIKLNRPTERPNGNTSADALDCERPSSASLAQLFVQLVCDTVVSTQQQPGESSPSPGVQKYMYKTNVSKSSYITKGGTLGTA